jgi:hypothetical protein
VLSFDDMEILKLHKSASNLNYYAIFYTKNQAMRKNLSFLNKKLKRITIYRIDDENLAKNYFFFNTGAAVGDQDSLLVVRRHDNMRKFYNGPVESIPRMERFLVDNQYPDIVYLTKDSYRWLKTEPYPYLAYITNSFKKDSLQIQILKKNARKNKSIMLTVLVENNNKWSKLFANLNGVFGRMMPRLVLVIREPRIYSGHVRAIYGGEAGLLGKPKITEDGLQSFVEKFRTGTYERFYKSDVGISNSEDTNMKVLTARNFEKYVLEDGHNFNVVFFYDSKCKKDKS